VCGFFVRPGEKPTHKKKNVPCCRRLEERERKSYLFQPAERHAAHKCALGQQVHQNNRQHSDHCAGRPVKPLLSLPHLFVILRLLESPQLNRTADYLRVGGHLVFRP